MGNKKNFFENYEYKYQMRKNEWDGSIIYHIKELKKDLRTKGLSLGNYIEIIEETLRCLKYIQARRQEELIKRNTVLYVSEELEKEEVS